MTTFPYTAQELFQWLTNRHDLLLLDVRNSQDFQRFQVEGPFPIDMRNISYFDFMEIEDECVAQLPKDKPIRVLCVSEGSAKLVADILAENGFKDVGYLEGGIKTWGNLLSPIRVNEGEPFDLYQFIRPGKGSCSYGIGYQGELMIVDPSRNIDFYTQFARENKYTLLRTCETHLQADYISGSRQLMELTGIQMVGNANDFGNSRLTYTALEDNQLLPFSNDGPEVKAIFTPGHTPGSTSYSIDGRYLISGDTIFIESVGRPDLGGKVDEWAQTLYTTLQKVKDFDRTMQVLPGHYMSWQEANSDLAFMAPLGKAIDNNRQIYDIGSSSEFLKFIKENMREQPPEYAIIRKINANLEQADDDKADELDLGKNECAATKARTKD